jgi:sugar O-acyltransferase (sialic acid O-acetyltransferase NeuD family)
MVDVVIYGTGGTSRDTLEALEAANTEKRQWNILGFVDDCATLQGTAVMDYSVLGTGDILCELRSLANAKIALGVANHRDGLVRKQIRAKHRLDPSRFPVILHPLAVVSRRAHIGVGTILLAGSSCATGASIGQHVVVLQGAAIGHDATVGDYATISANAALGGSTVVAEGAYVGLGAAVLPGTRVGLGSTVGIGAVVLEDVPDRVLVIGNPARCVRSVAT